MTKCLIRPAVRSLVSPVVRPVIGQAGTSAPPVFDFTGGSLPAGVTLQRASGGTYVDNAGVLHLASTDAARFDHAYDGGSFVLQGLLVEPQRTNKALATQSLGTGALWNPIRSSVSADAAAAPDGTTTADKVVANTDNNSHGLAQLWGSNYGFNPVIGQDYCMSGYYKAGGYGWVNHFPDIYAWGVGGDPTCYLNLSTGALGTLGGLIDETWVERLADGWWRLTSRGQAVSTNSQASQVSFTIGEANNDNVFVGNGSDGIFMWGWQLEAAAFPTSYIPNSSTTTTATRAADVLTLPIPDGTWNLSAETPNGTFEAAGVVVSGGGGYEFDWADFTGATTERHVRAVTAGAA